MPQIHLLGLGLSLVVALGSAIYLLLKDEEEPLTYQRPSTRSYSPYNNVSNFEARGRKRPSNKNDWCVICCETLTPPPDVTTLSCHHTFHTHCIKKWINIKKDCPICRNVNVH